ncbi:MAG: hypothetical protein AAB345_02920 [Patescibacteria group bacterium]
MNKKILIGLVGAAILLVGGYLLVGPGKSVIPLPGVVTPPVSGTKPAPAPTTGGLVQVAIRGFSFVGASTKVVPGTTVVWKNFDDAPHSVIGANFQSKTLNKGDSYSYKFTQEGTYIYYDGLHYETKGEIIVRNSNF